jgi:hypothetical protein
LALVIDFKFCGQDNQTHLPRSICSVSHLISQRSATFDSQIAITVSCHSSAGHFPIVANRDTSVNYFFLARVSNLWYLLEMDSPRIKEVLRTEIVEARWDHSRGPKFSNFFAQCLLVYYLVMCAELQKPSSVGTSTT